MAGLVSGQPSTFNVLIGPKHCGILQESTFILLAHHSDVDRAGKSDSLSDLKSYECLCTQLTANTKYSPNNTGYLPQPVQMHLP